MIYRTLGKSDIKVSALGMGCWAIGGVWDWAQPGQKPWAAGWGKTDDNESISAIHAGLDVGINFFDTAANYGAGHSEIILGQALSGRRESAIIATKFGHVVNEETNSVHADDSQIPGNLRGDVENSLRRLQTDYIDVYQLHQGSYPADLAAELLETLEDLVAQGKIRWYGWSTDLVDRARVFAQGEHCTSIQFSLNAIHDNSEMRALISEFNLAGINKDPLNKGILTGKFSSETTFPVDDIRSGTDYQKGKAATSLQMVEALRDIFTSGGRSMAQGALSYIWGLDDQLIPIPGFRTTQQVLDNAGAMEFGPLTSDEVAQVQAAVKSCLAPDDGQ